MIPRGYLGPYFNNNPFEKVIEAMGEDWIVARDIETNHAVFCHFRHKDIMKSKLIEWLDEDDQEELDSENDIPMISNEEIEKRIRLFQKSSGCQNTVEYKKAIAEGYIINYSRANLSIWEMYEEMLDKNE